MAYGELGTGISHEKHHQPQSSVGKDEYRVSRPMVHTSAVPQQYHQHMSIQQPPSGATPSPQSACDHDEFHTPYAASEASMSSAGQPNYSSSSADRSASRLAQYNQPVPVRSSYHDASGSGTRASSSVSAGDFSSFNEWYKFKMHRFTQSPAIAPAARETRGTPRVSPGDASGGVDGGVGSAEGGSL